MRIIEIIAQRDIDADMNVLTPQSTPLGQDSKPAQAIEARLVEDSWQVPCVTQGRRIAFTQRQTDPFVIKQALQRFIVKHQATQDAGLSQMHESIHDHLAGSVQAALERRVTPNALRQRRSLVASFQTIQDLPIVRVALMPQDQGLYQGIGKRSDSNLQGATIGNQGACMQADRIFDVIDILARQREQAMRTACILKHEIQHPAPVRDVRVASKER